MNEGSPARRRGRRWLPWAIAAALLVLACAIAWDLLEGPRLHAARPLPAPPAGTLVENLERLEGATPGRTSWPLLQEVLHHYQEPGRPGLPDPDATAEERAEHLAFLEDNRSLLPLLREAAAMPHYGLPLDPVEYWESRRDFLRSKGDAAGADEADAQAAGIRAEPLLALMPYSSSVLDLRNLVNLLALSAQEAAADGRPLDALADLESAWRLGGQLLRRPMLIEQLTGASLDWIAQSELRALLMQRSGSAGEGEWERFAASPMLAPVTRRPLADMVRGEWWWQLTVADAVFQDGGASSSVLRALSGLGGDRGWSLESLAFALHAGREDTLRMMGAVHETLLGLEGMAPAAREAFEVPGSILPRGVLGNSRYALVHMMASPAIYAAFLDAEAHRQVGAEASRCVLALVRYQAAEGAWPDSLEALVPGYLEGVPRDVDARSPLVYRVTGGAPALYSVGPDGVDDAGGGDDQGFLPIDSAVR